MTLLSKCQKISLRAALLLKPWRSILGAATVLFSLGRNRKSRQGAKRDSARERHADAFVERCARDETGTRKHEGTKAAYEKACFGKLRSSGKKRAAFEFLRRLRLSRDYDRESTDPKVMSRIILPIEMVYLSPLLEPLNALDAEFFDGLAEAMRILQSLQSYEKDPTDKWLIEHEEEIKGCTPEEIIKRFGSQFQVTSPDKLHRRLNKLGLDHQHKPRGKASPEYGRHFN